MNIYFAAQIIYELESAERTHTMELFRNLEKIGHKVSLFMFTIAKNTENTEKLCSGIHPYSVDRRVNDVHLLALSTCQHENNQVHK